MGIILKAKKYPIMKHYLPCTIHLFIRNSTIVSMYGIRNMTTNSLAKQGYSHNKWCSSNYTMVGSLYATQKIVKSIKRIHSYNIELFNVEILKSLAS